MVTAPSLWLRQADALLNLLKATHYKLLLSHSEVTGSAQPSSQFAEYITTTRDKQVRGGGNDIVGAKYLFMNLI